MMKTHRERGFLTIGILVALLFMGMATIALIWREDIRRAESYVAEGAGLMQVRNALQKYAVVNKQAFIDGETVMRVNDQFSPTLEELGALGYFASVGVNANPYGSSYKTKIDIQDGAITGMAYITGSVTKSDGTVNPAAACGIAKALGDIGLCSNPVNASMLGNLRVQTPNPTGLPAVVAAMIYVAP